MGAAREDDDEIIIRRARAATGISVDAGSSSQSAAG
jgi:hypothetical protein